MKLSERILVIDLEATCWEYGKMPAGSIMEILEIGICTLIKSTGQITDKQSIYVIPERSEISDFCVSLTGITAELVQEKGIGFKEACQKIADEYQSNDLVWGSYGEFDRKLFQKQCTERQIPYPLGDLHINIKEIFASEMKLIRGKGLVKALKIIKEPFEGTHHSGADDAYNTAKILRRMLENGLNEM